VYLGVVEAATVRRWRQSHVHGAVAAHQQPVTGRLYWLVVQEARRVEDGGGEQDDEDGDARATRPDVTAGV